ncbi:MAG TPA: MFS transporter [Ktedonosporobacter sp.]|nr:MFS transporter [Ktedonosporobacter sp.]
MSATSDTEPVATRAPSRLSAFLINRNFAWLFLGQGVSLLGDQIFGMILIVWVATQIAANQTWAPLATSGLIVASMVPILLVGPMAGVFVDRWDLRRTMMWTDLLRAGLIGSLFILPLLQNITPLLKLVLIYSAVFLETTCAQFFNPARFALLGDIVPQEKRAQATGIEQVSQAVSVILGPSIAAPLLFGVGVVWAILLNALSFVLSFCAIRVLRLPPTRETSEQKNETKEDEAPEGVRAQFMQGAQFAFGNRVVKAIIISIFLLTLSVGSFPPLSVFFVQQNLHASAQDTGILLSFFGGGAVLGAILFGMLAQRIGLRRLFAVAILLAGLLYILMSRLNNFVLACIVVLAIGMLQAALNVTASPMFMEETPKYLLGRVASIIGPLTTLGGLISVVCAGYVSGVLLVHMHLSVMGLLFGPVDTVLTISGMIMVIGGVYASFALLGAKRQQ